VDREAVEASGRELGLHIDGSQSEHHAEWRHELLGHAPGPAEILEVRSRHVEHTESKRRALAIYCIVSRRGRNMGRHLDFAWMTNYAIALMQGVLIIAAIGT